MTSTELYSNLLPITKTWRCYYKHYSQNIHFQNVEKIQKLLYKVVGHGF